MTSLRPAVRTAAAAVAVTALALLAAACGSSPGGHVAQLGATTQTGSSTSSTQAVAFARCMRSHGVPNWPDPNSSGIFDKSELTLQRLGVTGTELQAAQTACRRLLPGGGGPQSPAARAQMRAQALSFAQCMRAHGVQNFPDPGSDGRIPDPATGGINQGTPKFEAANQACGRYRPPYFPSNAAYNAYARSHG